MRRATILFLEFVAALAGNLMAGWIQQDIFNNVFSIYRLVGTIVGAILMLLLITLLDRATSGSNEARPTSVPKQITQLHIPKEGKNSMKYDFFISHASEDKDDFVRPLAVLLQDKGYKIWYDEFTVELGDSLRAAIDHGLSKSKYGIVVLSHAFFSRNWPVEELNALFARQMAGKKVILPIWHNISYTEILDYSPLLADKFALSTSDRSISEIVDSISAVLNQD